MKFFALAKNNQNYYLLTIVYSLLSNAFILGWCCFEIFQDASMAIDGDFVFVDYLFDDDCWYVFDYFY